MLSSEMSFLKHVSLIFNRLRLIFYETVLYGI